jgi:hypothetical protein
MNDTYIGIAGVVKDIDLEGHSWGTESGKGLGPFGTQPEIVVNRGCFAS